MESMKSRMLWAEYPRRLIAHTVGMRGSSHPLTRCSSTSVCSLRLLITVYVRLSLLNSICLGL